MKNLGRLTAVRAALWLAVAVSTSLLHAQEKTLKKDYEYVYDGRFYRITFSIFADGQLKLEAQNTQDTIRFLGMDHFGGAVDSVLNELVESDSMRAIMASYWRGRIEADLLFQPAIAAMKKMKEDVDSLKLGGDVRIATIGIRQHSLRLRVDKQRAEKIGRQLQAVGRVVPDSSGGKNDSLAVFDVDRVEIAFEDGLIRDLQVKGTIRIGKTVVDDKAVFQNQKSLPFRIPQHLAALSEERRDLAYKRGDLTFGLNLSDVLYVDRQTVGGTANYMPDDREPVVLTNDSSSIALYRRPFSSQLDLRFYTDVDGLSRKEPNGLIQLEGTYAIPGFLELSKRWCSTDFFLLKGFAIFLRFSKIENKLRNITLRSDSVSTFDLQDYASLSTGLRINVISGLSPTRDIGLDVTLAAMQTNMDSVRRDDTSFVTQMAHSLYCMPEVYGKFKFDERINSEFRLGVQHLDLRGKSVRQYDRRWICRTEMSLNIHAGGQNKNSSIFLRWIGIFHESKDDFSWQIGYKTALSEIFGW